MKITGWCDEHNLLNCPREHPSDLQARLAALEAEHARCQASLREAQHPRIVTRCPSCGSQSLTLTETQQLVCTWIPCRQPVPEQAWSDVKVRAGAAEDRLAYLQQEWIAHKPSCATTGIDARFGWRQGDEKNCNCGLAAVLATESQS